MVMFHSQWLALHNVKLTYIAAFAGVFFCYLGLDPQLTYPPNETLDQRMPCPNIMIMAINVEPDELSKDAGCRTSSDFAMFTI